MYRVKLRGKTKRKDSKAVVVQGKVEGGRPRGRIARQWLYRVKLRGKTKRKDSKAVVVQGKVEGEDHEEG